MALSGLYFSLLMRKYWLRFIIATLIGVLYFLYLLYAEAGTLSWKAELLPFLISSIITANLISLIFGISDKWLNRLLPWRDHMSLRLILGMIVNLLLALGIMLALGYLVLSQISEYTFNSVFELHSHTVIKLVIITTLAILIYSIIYFALFSYNEYAVVHINAMKNQRKQLKLQFEALKSQLSPHYLFNCLNTISSLIYRDPTLAEDFIRRLAQTYQYILTNNNRRFVTLEEEIEFVKSYNYLLKVRFENNLHLEINLPANIMDSRIPPLTLQMLVENAVKHNVINKDKPLNIYISAIDNTDIKVTNTKTEVPANVTSFHVGLDNIKQRYSYFTSRKIHVENLDKFTVKLPVIKKELAQST